MRHVYTNRVVVLISGLLGGAAVLWAWARSSPGESPAGVPGVRTAASPAGIDSVLGREVYIRACISCHAPDDPAYAAPSRLRARTVALLGAEGLSGRGYLVRLMVFGASGRAGGERLRHPPFGGLSDAEIAAVLNVLTDRPPDPPFMAEEIARAREEPLTREQVGALRPAAP